tara:strand:+ start:11205 stop:12425 length:1221 start_codon:yes stop_codon:yes gene_type:complete
MGKGKKNKGKKCVRHGCKNNAPKGKSYCKTHNYSSTSTGFGSGYKITPKPPCHTGQNSVFTVGDIEVFAGGRNRNGGWQKMNPPADLAMGPSETLGSWGASKTEVPEGWTCGDTLTEVEPLMISFDWPDFSIPKVGKEFWYALVNDIHEHGIKRISCQCAGGHGRTGVQLAILAYLLGDDKDREFFTDAATLTKWVRDAHCHHAVEAQSQQKYIAEVCNIPLGEMLIAEVSYGGNYWGGSNQWADIQDVDDDKIMTLAEVAEDEFDAMQDEEFDEPLLVIEDEEDCPLCTAKLDDSYCHTCHHDSLTWEDDSTLHTEFCPMCDGEHPKAYMVPNLGVCVMCHASALDLKIRASQEKVQCCDCNKYKPAYQFFRYHQDDTTCSQCYNGMTNKKPPKRSPKKLEDVKE